MLNTAPQPSSTLVVPAEDSARYLAQAGINIRYALEALDNGEVAAGNSTDYEPVTAAGTLRWIYSTGTLRRLMVTEEGWKLGNPNNRPTVSSPDERFWLGIVGGNQDTGKADTHVQPKAHRAKGRATEEAVNQTALFTLPRPDNQASVLGSVPPPGGWFLLYFRDETGIRAEISLPNPDFRDGQFGTWKVRCILPYRGFDSDLKTINDIGGGDVEFRIA